MHAVAVPLEFLNKTTADRVEDCHSAAEEGLKNSRILILLKAILAA